MDDINSKDFKKKYLKSKIKLRQWENEFMAKNGRLPTKADIKTSPATIREYYKIYYTLKTKMLEAQILGDDKPPEDTITRSKSDGVLKEHTNITNQPQIDSETWGTHLNRTPTAPVIEKERCTLLSKTIAERLFKGSSFKKRNPRKSFKKKKSEGSKSLDSPDISSMSPYLDPQVDQNLNGSLFSVESDCSPNIKALITTSASLSPLLAKPKIVEERKSAPVQPVSLIQVVAADPSVGLTTRTLDAGWVERCNQNDSKEERKGSDSGFESMEFSKVDDSSDDDLIAGSDNEHETTKLGTKRKPEPSPSLEVCKKVKLDPLQKTQEDVKKTILERKIQTGKLNENYVKINLKKKVFVRGKRNFNYARYKKREWKNKKKNLEDGKESGGVVQCYKCGDTGHFSRYCQKGEDKLLDMEEEDDLPTLEEAQKMAEDNRCVFEKPEEESRPPRVEPLFNTQGETPPEVYEALRKFGHTEFRPGQEETIMRILCGLSTLVTIATGRGKSLCYQLPAYLYAKRSKCITLVVSPLVSLMEDQVSGSSTFFKVGCLHTSQTQKQRESVMEEAKSGKLFALLVSPEAVVSGDSSTLGYVFRQLPPIAFACIDEVHCVSQWSHNFRPSYLLIAKTLREKLGVTTILGLTATATLSTINSITSELGVTEEGVIKDVPLPDNLYLSISRDENKDEALISLLQSEKYKNANAILIYCTRRDECERLAVFIRTRLQNKSKSVAWNAESYHAGMAAGRRKQVQKAFMRGNLRILIATVAFGMGINKQDIRGVIHYNMPKDFESYVQEVGRAGRDGMLAYCHLFLDPHGGDLNELRRHIHSNSVDRHVLRKLLQRVFIQCDCTESCRKHEIAFEINDTIQSLDLPEENIHTLLCYLDGRFITVQTPVYKNCKIKSYRGMKAIASAARKNAPLAYACASQSNKSDILSFDVIQLANKLNWDSGIVKNQLKKAEWELTVDGKWKKTGISMEFYNLAFRVRSRGDMTPSELDEALDYLTERVESQEQRANTQLNITFSAFDHYAQHGGDLKRLIREYFEKENLPPEIPMKELKVEDFDEEVVAGDVRTLICTYRDNTFNGRAVARIFHGIQSPNYPASLWYKCRFWRKHINKDFKKIIRLATIEILRLKV